MRADIHDGQGAKHSRQWAEYRCARPIISRSPHPACTARPVHTKYMIRRRRPPSQSWRTFLRNHAEAIAAIDLCVVPTVRFERLFAFVIICHGRRRLLWFAVTRHPTAEWLAQQIVEAFPWETAPTYLVRDNDGAYGPVFQRRVRAMGIRDRPISPRSPWQGGLLLEKINSINAFVAGYLAHLEFTGYRTASKKKSGTFAPLQKAKSANSRTIPPLWQPARCRAFRSACKW